MSSQDTSATNTVEQSTGQQQQSDQSQVRLVDAVINNQHTALNVLVGFIGVAQRRGTFAFDESAKIYECIKSFQQAQGSN